jgi:fructokinase
MDVNLRDPWWRREQVLEWVGQADWVKLNEAELDLLQGRQGDLASRAGAFLAQHALEGLVVTRGSQGACLLLQNQPPFDVAPVAALQMVDTVGAGDALAAVLLTGLNQGWPMRQTLERAQHFASAVVGQRGATVHQADFFRPFISAWGLS